ncbi:MAG TPA: LysR family transcriptional regulator [Acidimicrobiales bacterium]|nr:LysR family transcriptional regulator [Acidimicrobiales bacterium]
MQLRQLEALVAVADHGTFSAAADHLLTVQSNVSAHIARLEQELGATLVDRRTGELTDAGDAAVARARRVASELAALASDVAAVGSIVVGKVRLGVIGTTARWLVPALLRAVAAEYPRVNLVVVEATSTSLEPRVTAGDLDLAVVNLTSGRRTAGGDLIADPLFEEDLVLVVPGGHALADRGEVDLSELDGLGLLMPPVGTAFRGELDAAARAAGITIPAVAELDGLRLIASLTMQGDGAAILPASALPTWVDGPFHRVSVRGLPRRAVGLTRRRRDRLTAPSLAVVGLIREVVASGTAAPPGVHRSVPAADGR